MGQNNMAFFFTRGMSLQKWHEIGMLEREIAPYNILAEHFDTIYFFSYGGKEELRFKKYLKPNIKIVCNYHNINKNIYSLILPFLNFKVIKKCRILKTNQMDGTWTAFISKLLNWRSKIILRTGYTASLFYKKRKSWSKYLLFSLIESVLYPLCDAAFVTSRGDKEYLQRKYYLNSKKIKIIPNYINIELFRPANVNKFSNQIIFVGRLNKQKNIFNLIQALKGTNIRLGIIGQGELKKNLQNLADKLKVDVKFIGSVQNSKLPDYLNKYPIFILPSSYEGMPKTLLEAMSCGLSCIGTDVAGINEVIIDDENGLLSKTDYKSLRETILKLINDKKLQKKLGKNAREFIVDNYSLKKMIKKEIKVYEKVDFKK